jgi:hypothetical protein
MKVLIQSIEDDFDCHMVDLDENNYITESKPVDIDDIIFDDQTKNILQTKPYLENVYFQIGPSYRFNAWKI